MVRVDALMAAATGAGATALARDLVRAATARGWTRLAAQAEELLSRLADR